MFLALMKLEMAHEEKAAAVSQNPAEVLNGSIR